ncbi:DUF4817 domain-containing protein [Trichonephila clavipes]|nr:DUF4817 domain-containing protein [Trichonephila clavipes]
MLWSRQIRAFVVEAYFSNGRPMIVVQRVFRLHFDIPPRCRVPDRKCVLMWMDVSKGRKGPPKTIITHENVGRVRVTIQTGMGQ